MTPNAPPGRYTISQAARLGGTTAGALRVASHQMKEIIAAARYTGGVTLSPGAVRCAKETADKADKALAAHDARKEAK